MENHESVIVTKPWGHEYLAYKNNDVALWFLHINPGEKTSMHCHPTKSTGLVVLNGEAEINFIADKKTLIGPSKQMIRRGLFHQTVAVSKDGVDMFEIETPVDKNDLVRLKDNYGRTEAGYEKEDFQLPKSHDCLWLDEPELGQQYVYKMLNTTLIIERPMSINFVYKKSDSDILMFLSGGLYKNVEGRIHNVVIPGDVGNAIVVKEVASQMTGFLDNTIVLTINDQSK